jgi:hypothetical protein
LGQQREGKTVLVTESNSSKGDAALLAEIEQLLRTTPESSLFDPKPENLEWLGRAQAAMSRWDQGKGAIFRLTATHFQSTGAGSGSMAPGNWAQLVTMLYEARSEIRSRIAPPVAEVFEEGQRFEYFDEIRKLIELARTDLFFVDPHIDAEFVSRYLPHVRTTAGVRLLTYKHVKSAVPAAELYSQQHGLAVAIRSDPSLHDRFVFIDGRECYFSGGSFKDGGKKSAIILMQITDAFGAVKQVYEDAWKAAKVESP